MVSCLGYLVVSAMVILVGPWFSLDEMTIFPLPGGFGSKVDLGRLVTWSAAVDIKAAPVFVSFPSYTSYSQILHQIPDGSEI